MSKKELFKPKKIAVAVAATLLTTVAVASVIQYAIDESNLTRDVANAVTYVFADATKADQRGYLVVDDKEGIVMPGIGVYTENFKSGADYNGCIMSSKGEPPVAVGVTTCAGDPDSGKRFKLKSEQLNKPMDIAFNLTNTGDTNLYNIYGKFTNDTDVPATGFTVQIGTGIGANFRELPNVTIVGGTTQLGKYPGGLFGGSPAEGLPFFDVESARFSATAETETSVHTRTTDGMPTQYTALFPDGWLPLIGVPLAWFFDTDGMPWTDDKLVAYDDNGTWTTYDKVWTSDTLTMDGNSVDLTNVPNIGDFTALQFPDVKALTPELNTLWGTSYSVQEVVGALLLILDLVPDDTVDPAGEGWTTNPPTVIDPANGDALVATWDYTNEVYIVEIPYQGVLGGETVPMETLQTLVNNTTYDAVPGYSQGVIEDLSNVNVYSAVQVAGGVTGPLTMRVFVTDADATIDDPLPPAPPPSSDDGGGCTVGGNGRFDPTLPALAAAGLVFFGLRRFKASK